MIPLADAAGASESDVGGKGAKLGMLARAGFTVPEGFCLTSHAYRLFLEASGLKRVIQMELGRKPLAKMRWEEIWDAALRIRTRFTAESIPGEVSSAALAAATSLEGPLVVRSSAPGEDSSSRSFAGLHESIIGVEGESSLLDAIKIVWASLWSDAALLYRRELNLDPSRSAMAVVVQRLIDSRPSGVGFGADPRDPSAEVEIIEAVPGRCADLVDGLVDPDRWILRRSSGEIIEFRAGAGEERTEARPALEREDLSALHETLVSVESLLGWPPDVEWTGRKDQLTLLQARPVTAPARTENDEERGWYMSLRPGAKRLKSLRERVAGDLIPRMEIEGARLAAEKLENLSDAALAAAVEARLETLSSWKKIYWDEFIPFAHGVRQLAVYYNDAVKPSDPYEFVGLLESSNMIAVRRNKALSDLANKVIGNRPLRKALTEVLERIEPAYLSREQRGRPVERKEPRPQVDFEALEDSIESIAGGRDFMAALRGFLADYLGVAYSGERLDRRPDLALRMALELAGVEDGSSPEPAKALDRRGRAEELKRRLLEAVGPRRRDEAEEVIATGRLSWKLRDDDNILIGRIEGQLLRALELGASRLRARGTLAGEGRITVEAASTITGALMDPHAAPFSLPQAGAERRETSGDPGESPRQIVGQPAAPGIYTGKARVVASADDLGRFKAGEVLVCDSIQPTMTHLIPLAGAIVERRGGMLIHGAIIARELGIPCVNGVEGAAELLHDGDLVTADGHLGIVTVGPPEFDLERAGLAGKGPP